MSGGPPHRAYYVAAIDRVGLAILAGGALTGGLAAALVLARGQTAPIVLGLAWLTGTLLGMAGIVAVAGPVWLVLHVAGRRGPWSAAATAGLLALALLSIGQMRHDVGGDYRWASALATGGILALIAAAIGWVMQRIAYRRLL
ncbi:MAG: hypothetical protein V4537_06720 [Pseudomonadota bacterium]